MTNTQGQMPRPKIGSTVTIGKGKKHWTVKKYWTDKTLVTLESIDGYTGTTVENHRIFNIPGEKP